LTKIALIIIISHYCFTADAKTNGSKNLPSSYCYDVTKLRV